MSRSESDLGRRPGVARILLDNAEELVASLLLCAIGAALSVQVLMRTAFGTPLGWPEELSQFLFVWASVLGAVGAIKRVGLVRVESIVERLPAPVGRFLDKLILLLAGVLLGVVGWQGWQMAVRTTYAAAALPITWFWMYSAAAVFAVLAALRLVQVHGFGYRFAFVERLVPGRSAGRELGP